MPRNLVVLGSTGSIGRQTLDVARSFPDKIRIYGLAAHQNAKLLADQVEALRPAVAVLEEAVDPQWKQPEVEFLSGEDGVIDLVTRPEVDMVVVGTAGSGGVKPTVAALQAGKLVALANKETLVMAGSIIQKELERSEGDLVPIDSEHSAIWQCINGEPSEAVERLTLTASGGALRDLSIDELLDVTPEQALRHPTWSMGKKITIDSANLMNKGLEAIEAQWLFEVSLDQIEIVAHPQSIVHSLVTFQDGSTKAQLGLPDMRLPIQYALSHPERWVSSLPRLELVKLRNLTFETIDLNRYPAVRIALEAARHGGTYPAVLSASDEIAVEEFLAGRIRFTQITEVVEATLNAHSHCPSPTLDDILGAETWARDFARRLASS